MLSAISTPDALWMFGIISAGLSLWAYFPYTRDTILGRTQPQRASWFVWSFLGSMSLATQIADNATDSLWFVAIQVGGTLFIFLLSLWRGTGGLMRSTDCKVIAISCVGIGLWYATDNPAWALGIAIAVSLLGGLVTVAKAYADPDSETMAFWAFSAVSAVFAIAAIGAWDPMKLAYPMYILLLNAAIISAMIMGRAPKTPVPPVIEETMGPALQYSRVHLQGVRPEESPHRKLTNTLTPMW